MANPTRAEIGEALLASIGGGTMSLALGAPDVSEIRPQLQKMGLVRGRPTAPATPAVDPSDPLTGLTDAERSALEADPTLRQRFLDRVTAAEAAVTAERERQKNLDEAWRAHDAREAADRLAQQAIEQRAAARAK